MRPTKNRVYCVDSGRIKMLFETRKKASNFMKFNSEGIETAAGYSPTRSYYCMHCCGWHVTSKGREVEDTSIKPNTLFLLELYNHTNNEKELRKVKIGEIKRARIETSGKYLEAIESSIQILENYKEYRKLNICMDVLNLAFTELQSAKQLTGINERTENLEYNLCKLRREIEATIQ